MHTNPFWRACGIEQGENARYVEKNPVRVGLADLAILHRALQRLLVPNEQIREQHREMRVAIHAMISLMSVCTCHVVEQMIEQTVGEIDVAS
jgi:ABC-type uncharacterized transport system permease subunit